MEAQGPDAEAAGSGSAPAAAVLGTPGLVAGLISVPGDALGLADWLTAAVPGPDLVGVLAGLDGAQRDEEVLVEGIAGWERVIAWAAARQAELVSTFAGLEPSSRHLEFVGDALACRLAVTRRAVEYKTGLDVG
jgi:hypothetical protein